MEESPLLNRAVRWLTGIVHPRPAPGYEEARERLRLLRAIQLTFIAAGLFVLSVAFVNDPGDLHDIDFQAGAVIVILTIAWYILAHLGYFQLSSTGFVVLLFCIFTLVPYFPDSDPWFLAYNVAPVMLTGVFFSLEWMALASILSAGLTFVLNQQLLARADHWEHQHLWYFLIIAYTLVFALLRHLRIVERIRCHELETANRQLRESETRLEERVTQRTAELQTAYEQIQMLNHAKDEFVSNVSHELRTPITNMKLQHYLLKTKAVAGQETHLTISGRELDRLSNLIELLLSLSRLDQGRTDFKFASIDLNALAQDYIGDRAALAAERDLTLNANLADGPVTVWADGELIGQALSVLLTNAFDYTPSGGQVTICTQQTTVDGASRDWGAIGVRDTGPGIPPDEQADLFTRFFRGSAALMSGAPGTGLGLSIAKAIVDQHQGRIEVESKGIPGKGTLFRILLPPHPQQVQEGETTCRSSALASS